MGKKKKLVKTQNSIKNTDSDVENLINDFDANVSSAMESGIVAVTENSPSLMGMLYGDLIPSVMWKMTFLCVKMRSLEERCTCLCMLTDYLARECTSLGMLDSTTASSFCGPVNNILRVLATTWSNTILACHKNANLFAQLSSNFEKSVDIFRSFHLDKYFIEPMKLVRQIQSTGEASCTHTSPAIPRHVRINFDRLQKILDSALNVRNDMFAENSESHYENASRTFCSNGYYKFWQWGSLLHTKKKYNGSEEGLVIDSDPEYVPDETMSNDSFSSWLSSMGPPSDLDDSCNDNDDMENATSAPNGEDLQGKRSEVLIEAKEKVKVSASTYRKCVTSEKSSAAPVPSSSGKWKVSANQQAGFGVGDNSTINQVAHKAKSCQSKHIHDRKPNSKITSAYESGQLNKPVMNALKEKLIKSITDQARDKGETGPLVESGTPAMTNISSGPMSEDSNESVLTTSSPDSRSRHNSSASSLGVVSLSSGWSGITSKESRDSASWQGHSGHDPCQDLHGVDLESTAAPEEFSDEVHQESLNGSNTTKKFIFKKKISKEMLQDSMQRRTKEKQNFEQQVAISRKAEAERGKSSTGFWEKFEEDFRSENRRVEDRKAEVPSHMSTKVTSGKSQAQPLVEIEMNKIMREVSSVKRKKIGKKAKDDEPRAKKQKKNENKMDSNIDYMTPEVGRYSCRTTAREILPAFSCALNEGGPVTTPSSKSSSSQIPQRCKDITHYFARIPGEQASDK